MSGRFLPKLLVSSVLSATRLRPVSRGLRNYLYDLKRFCKHSAALNPRVSLAAERAQLTKAYHRIEQGFTLPDPRPGFGHTTVIEIMSRVKRLEGLGASGLETEAARGTLLHYAAFHNAYYHRLPNGLMQFLADSPSASRPGGVIQLTRSDLSESAAIDFDSFARNRYSVRQYTGAPVPRSAIEQAVATALKSPCVCNRESRRVFVAFELDTRNRLLAHQNGNHGFGHLAGAVLLIAVDQRSFTDFGERNQGWIDGGLFTMSLVYALHAQGFGTCLLNWSAVAARDKVLRAEFDIPDHMNVITMISVGCLPEEITVAYSPRPQVSDVLNELT